MEDYDKLMMCAKYLIIKMLDTDAEKMTLNVDGFSKSGVVLGDFQVIVKRNENRI